MNVQQPADPSAFLAATRDLLLEDEARHNLLLGIAGTLRDHPDVYREHRLWVLEDDGLVVGAALRTPPYNLVVARPLSEDALVALAQVLDSVDVPGVTGAIPEADVFAAAWESRTGTTRRRRMAQRIYKLTEVRAPVDVPGGPREARAADRELLVAWVRAFAEEAIGPGTPGHANPEQIVDARLAQGTGAFMLWEDGEAVSMAGWGRPDAERRPRRPGLYASRAPPPRIGGAITAAVSAERLSSGRRFCFLYTDLANPTSNRIYLDIGYAPVCDSVDYAFEPA